MSDLSINTNNPVGATGAAEAAAEAKGDVKTGGTQEAQKDEALLTSEAIENSKIEADTLTTGKKEEAEPVVTDEMLSVIEDEAEEAVETAPEEETVLDTTSDVLDTTSDVLDINVSLGDNPNAILTTAEYVQQQKDEKAEKEAQAEVNKPKSNVKVKLVKKNGKWEAVKPDTPEFSARDRYMKNVKLEYTRANPEPPFSYDDGAEGSESAEHAKWKSDYLKHMKEQEKTYQENNKDYQEQYFAYRKAQIKAKSMN